MINVISPKFWETPDLTSYYTAQFKDGIPLKPGGIVRPSVAKLVYNGTGKKNKKQREGKQKKGGPIQKITQSVSQRSSAPPNAEPKAPSKTTVFTVPSTTVLPATTAKAKDDFSGNRLLLD